VDEVDCDFSLFLKYPSHHHICVRPETDQFMCLSIDKTNDGNIDCLGAMDKPNLCRPIDYRLHKSQFYCMDHSDKSCVSVHDLCVARQCKNSNATRFCAVLRKRKTDK
jgi:hypothetical protein